MTHYADRFSSSEETRALECDFCHDPLQEEGVPNNAWHVEWGFEQEKHKGDVLVIHKRCRRKLLRRAGYSKEGSWVCEGLAEGLQDCLQLIIDENLNHPAKVRIGRLLQALFAWPAFLVDPDLEKAAE